MEFGILLFVLISILLLVKRLMVKKTAKAAAYLLLLNNAKQKAVNVEDQDVIDSLNQKVENLFKNDIEEFKKLGMQYFDTLKDPNEAKKIVVQARDCGWNG